MRLGVNAQFADISAPVIDAAKSLGVGWVRTSVEWGFHQTEADYNADVAAAGASGVWPALQQFKTRIAYAHSKGISVLTTAMRAQSWACGTNVTSNGTSSHQAILPSKRFAFAEYCRQLALCGVDAIEVTNEPNLPSQYMFAPEHPRAAFPVERTSDWVLLLNAVYARVKGDPLTAACPIGIGAPAVLGHELIARTDGGIQPTLWYQALLHATADNRTTPVAPLFDFACVHPYAQLDSHHGPVDWSFRWGQFPNQYGDAAYAHGVAQIYRIRNLLVAAGFASKEIWATEFGAPTSGGASSVTEAEQAQWMSDYVTALTTSGPTGYTDPLSTTYFGSFMGPIFVYQLRDRSDGAIAPTDTEGFFGLQRYDGSHKPAWDVLKRAAGTVYVWAWLTAKTLRLRAARFSGST